MIRFESNLNLDNGAVATHFIVGMVTVSTKEILLVIDGFVNKDCADKALKEYELLNEQTKLIEDFKAKTSQETIDEDTRKEIIELQTQINQIADDIQNTVNYSDMVINTSSMIIPYSDDLSIDYIKNQITSNGKFTNIEFI